MLRRVYILICILAFFVLASASLANYSWTEFSAHLSGKEIIDDFYFNGLCWVAKGHLENGDIIFNVDGIKIEAQFDFYTTALYIKDRDPEQPPTHYEDAIIHGKFVFYDEERAFYGIFGGKGNSGKFYSTASEGKWESQEIQGEFTSLSSPGSELYEGELNGWWKNFEQKIPNFEDDDTGDDD
jgi:hypothetical protein